MTIPSGFSFVPVPTAPPGVPATAPTPTAAPAVPASAPPTIPTTTVQPVEPSWRTPSPLAPGQPALPGMPVAPTQPAQPVAAPVQPPSTPASAPTSIPSTIALDPNNLPNELRGKSPEQIMQIYSALREHYLTTVSQPANPSAPAAASRPSAPNPLEPEGSRSGSFWAEPEAYLNNFRKEILNILAPVVQNTTVTRAEKAMQAAAATLPNFQQMLPNMQPYLMHVDNEALSDPQVWTKAYHMAVGEAMVNGRLPNGFVPATTAQPAPTAPAAPAQPAASPFGVPWTPATFSEGPSQPRPGAGTPATTLTPEQDSARIKMGMDTPTYIAWMGGIPRG